MNIQEKEIDWGEFLNRCLKEGDELIRAYWYQAEKLSYAKVDFNKARRIIEGEHTEKTSTEKNKEAQKLVQKSEDWCKRQTESYAKQLHRYDEMSIEYPVIEMVRKGLIKIDPFKQTYLGEKGLDVAIAVHMVKFHKKCDKIILISGDLDYAEAIQYIKDELKIIHLVRLVRNQSSISTARMLLSLADDVINIDESEIRASFLKQALSN